MTWYVRKNGRKLFAGTTASNAAEYFINVTKDISAAKVDSAITSHLSGSREVKAGDVTLVWE